MVDLRIEHTMDQIKHTEGFFTNARGIELFYQSWVGQKTDAGICIVHGVGEHSGRYEEFARHMASKNITIFSFDLQGFGRSNGRRGHIDSFSQYADDIDQFIRFIRTKTRTTIPIFLLGHSLGALISIETIQYYPHIDIAGLIMSGPPLKLNFSFTAWQKKISVFLSSLMPALALKERNIDLNLLTHDKKKVETFRRDPLRHYQRTLQFVRAYVQAEKHVEKAYTTLTVSMLILQGAEDTIVDVKKVKEFYHSLRMEDKTFIVYPDMYHEVLNEVERSRVYADIYGWLHSRARVHAGNK